MPRGRGGSHKGSKGFSRHRHVGSFEDVMARNRELERKERIEEEGSESEEESSEESPSPVAKQTNPKVKGEGNDSGPEASDGSDDVDYGPNRGKGTAAVIDVANPNRSKGASKAEPSGVVELTRREREAIEAQEKQRRYEALHKAGKTDQAKADLARLEEVRRRRDEAAKKREEDKKKQEDNSIANRMAAMKLSNK